MKKFIIALVMGIVCVSSVNAQGFLKKALSKAKDAINVPIVNSQKVRVQIDTLYILDENKGYADIELFIIPEDSYVNCRTGNNEWYHQYMNASVKKKGDEIQVVRKDDVFIYIYKKDDITYGKIDSRGL